MEQRRYTVAEIDRMRDALVTISRPPAMLGYSPRDIEGRVEDRLRTYMLNGTDPEELESAASERVNTEIKRQRAYVADYESRRGSARSPDSFGGSIAVKWAD